MVRIRSEHAIGFLKGRFQSLKNLRVDIRNARTHQFATYWIAACVGVHAFAMQHEADERGGDDSDADQDFIQNGLSSDEVSREVRRQRDPAHSRTSHQEGLRLQQGRSHREKLKQALLQARRRRHRAHSSSDLESD